MIGERLYDLRKEAGLTQDTLAKILKINKHSISSYERDKSEPPDAIKIEIAKYFNVSLDYLLGLIDTPHPYKRDARCIYLSQNFPKEAENILNLYIEALDNYYNKQAAD